MDTEPNGEQQLEPYPYFSQTFLMGTGASFTLFSTEWWTPLYLLHIADLANGWGLYFVAAIVLFLFMGSAIVSGAEIAFFSLSPQQLNHLKAERSAANDRLLALLKKPPQLLATILIANNLFNIGIVILSYFLTGQTEMSSANPTVAYLVNTVLVTFALVLFGEVMPKVYATHNNMRLAKFATGPLSLFYFLLSPFSRLLARSTRFIERKLDQRMKHQISKSEIEQAINIVANAQTDLPEPAQRDLRMLKGIMQFGDIDVEEIMRNRMEIFAIDVFMPFDDLRQLLVDKGYSRVPVYKEDLDHIVGLLYVKDLLPHINEAENFKWQKLMRDPFFVPESKKIDDLLREIQENRTHLAIVVDEYGGTSGLVTLEDVLEEIVGEIEDEYDNPEDDIDFKKIDRYNYEFDGMTPIRDLCRVMRIDPEVFDNVEGDFNSIAGLLLELTGEIPEEDTAVALGRFQFRVLSIQENRLERISICIKHDKASEPA